MKRCFLFLTLILFFSCDNPRIEKELPFLDIIITGDYEGNASVYIDYYKSVMFTDSIKANLKLINNQYIFTFDDGFPYDFPELNLIIRDPISFKDLALYREISFYHSDYEPDYQRRMYNLSDAPYENNFINVYEDSGYEIVGMNLEVKSTDPDSVYTFHFWGGLALNINN